MNYQEFLKALSEEIHQQAILGTEVRFFCVPKNNGVKKDAVSVVLPGRRGAVPLFYTDDCYRQYLAGRTVVMLAGDLLKRSGEAVRQPGTCTERYGDFSNLREKICFRLVNREMNREYLQKVPFYPFLDLAAVYYYQPEEVPEDAVIVKRTDLMRWSVTEETLHALAMKNTPQLHPSYCVPIETVLDRICRAEEEPHEAGLETMSAENMQSDGLWVLTNRSQLHGASAMLYPGSFRALSDQLGKDLFILPSSIHEVLILPDTGAWSVEELSDMVWQINRTQLLKEEILSDTVYRYVRATGQIGCAGRKGRGPCMSSRQKE